MLDADAYRGKHGIIACNRSEMSDLQTDGPMFGMISMPSPSQAGIHVALKAWKHLVRLKRTTLMGGLLMRVPLL